MTGSVRPIVYTSMTGGGTTNSDHRYANLREGARFYVTHR